MSRPMTPPAGLASGAHCLPAGAWSTRRQTAPHTHRPPPQTQRHPSGVHTTHTGTAVSPSRVCHRGVRGLSAVRHALRPRQPGAPNPVESRRDGCADRGPGRPGEALTQTKPNPPPPPPHWNMCTRHRPRCRTTKPQHAADLSLGCASVSRILPGPPKRTESEGCAAALRSGSVQWDATTRPASARTPQPYFCHTSALACAGAGGGMGADPCIGATVPGRCLTAKGKKEPPASVTLSPAGVK